MKPADQVTTKTEKLLLERKKKTILFISTLKKWNQNQCLCSQFINLLWIWKDEHLDQDLNTITANNTLQINTDVFSDAELVSSDSLVESSELILTVIWILESKTLAWVDVEVWEDADAHFTDCFSPPSTFFSCLVRWMNSSPSGWFGNYSIQSQVTNQITNGGLATQVCLHLLQNVCRTGIKTLNVVSAALLLTFI